MICIMNKTISGLDSEQEQWMTIKFIESDINEKATEWIRSKQRFCSCLTFLKKNRAYLAEEAVRVVHRVWRSWASEDNRWLSLKMRDIIGIEQQLFIQSAVCRGTWHIAMKSHNSCYRFVTLRYDHVFSTRYIFYFVAQLETGTIVSKYVYSL